MCEIRTFLKNEEPFRDSMEDHIQDLHDRAYMVFQEEYDPEFIVAVVSSLLWDWTSRHLENPEIFWEKFVSQLPLQQP